MKDLKFLITAVLVIITVNVILYAKIYEHDFVDFNDPVYVTENSMIQKLDRVNLKVIFTRPYPSYYNPVTLLAHAAEYSALKDDPAGYHMINLAIHIINSLLVMFLVCIILRKGQAAVIIALIFSMHPVQVESVAWISGLRGLLFAMFYLLSFISYVYFSRKGRKPLYFLSLAFFVLAVLSKPIAVTFPVILLLFDYYEEKLDRPKIIEKIPFFVISVIFSVVILISRGENAKWLSGFLKTFIYDFYGIGFYLLKLIYPTDLAVYYAYPDTISFFSFESVIALLVVAVIIAYALNFKKFKKDVNFGILFFLVSLIPVMWLTPSGETFAADRHLYIPMIGLFFAIVTFSIKLVEDKPNAKSFAIAVLGLSLLYFSSTTFAQIDVWKDSKALWKNVLNIYPDNVEAHRRLSAFPKSQGSVEE